MIRKRYTDEQKTTSVAYLIANGYPLRKGAITYTQRKLKVSNDSLHRWYNSVNLEKLENEIMELEKLLENELTKVFDAMGTVRKDANYSALVTAMGVITDKLIVLSGGTNSRNETIIKDWRQAVLEARGELEHK